MGTTYHPSYYQPPAYGIIEWEQRTDGASASWHYNGKGSAHSPALPWEIIPKFAHLTEKDVWINIPVSASSGCMPLPEGDSCWASNTSSYVSQLATLLKEQLPEDTNIYLEHSNEAWNWGFKPTLYNFMNA